MKYSKSAIGLLTAQYRSVLKKCWLINVGLFALGAAAATPASAADAGTWTKAIEDTDAFMDNLASTSGGAWDRANGNVTGWGVDQILGIMGDTATKTDAAVALVNDTTKGNEALYTSLDGKQAKLTSTSGNAGNGISITDTGVISAKAGNTTITVDGDGIKVGTIAQSQVDGLATSLAGKQAQLTSGSDNVSSAVLTSVRDSSSAVDTALVSEKAVATAIETATTGMVTTDGTQTLTNKTIDADSNTISNIETDNFKSGVIQTTVRATASASDTALASEKAVATALDGKQAKLTSTSGNAGDGISITDTGVISAKAGDTTITVDGNGIKVGTIAQSQVNGLSDALDAKVNNADNFTAATDSDLIKNKTVVAAIKDTAAAVDVNATKNTTQDTSIGNLYTAVNGGTYNAATGEVTGASTLSSNFTTPNLTAAANELLTDITVTSAGNYIAANANVASNLSALDGQVKNNTDNITSMAALVGTTSAPAAGTGILAGKTITGTAGTNNLNMVDAISYVAANGAGLGTNNVYTGTNTYGSTSGSQVIIDNGGNLTANTSLKVGTSTTNMLTVSSAGTVIGAANAITGTAGSLDMGGNSLSNVHGLTLTDGTGHTNDATISVDANGISTGNKTLDVGTGALKSETLYVGTTDQFSVNGAGNISTSGTLDVTGTATVGSLAIGTTGKGFDANGNLTAGTISATGIDTTTANTVNLGGTGFTTAVTGGLTVSGDTALSGKLNVTGDTTLAKTDVTGDLTVTGNTSLANTSVAGTLDVTGKSTFGSATGSRIELDGGALTVKDSTQAQVAKIDNDGNASFNGTLDVAGLASLDGGINVNDKFAVDTNGKVTLSDGTNTATIEATQIKDSDGNDITNVMKVDGTGLYTGYVASESGFTVAQKDAVTGLYEETFTVNEDGDIETLGTLSVSDGKFAVDGDGAVRAANGEFVVDKDGNTKIKGALGAGATGTEFAVGTKGNIKAANGNFTVDKDGNTTVAGTMDIEGDTTIGNKFSVTAADGSFSAAGGKFTVDKDGAITSKSWMSVADGNFKVNSTGGLTTTSWMSVADGKMTVNSDGAIKAADGNFTVDKDGNVTAQGDLGVQGTSWLKDTNVDGALSVTGESWLKNTHVDGALATTGDASVGGNFAVTGSSWLSNTHVNGDLEVSGTTKTGALTFDGSSYVAAMDQGDAAITNGVVDDQAKRTMATVATVAKTIGKLDDKNAHGVTDVSDVASAISTLSQNVETATGGTFTDAVWTGAVDADKDVDYTYSPAATATATAGYHDIMSAVSQVASNVGAATTVAFNNVADDNTVNANIDALNRKVGNMNNIGYGYKNLSNGTTTQPDTVVEALLNIDASMGTIHGLADKLEKAGTYQGNLAEGTTVEQHLTALDSAIGNRANFNKMHYTQGSKTVVDAIGKLDTKLNSVDHDVRTLRHKFQSGMASAAALSALVPNARAHGNTQLSVGTGMYHGHGAMAVGGFHWFTDNILFNTGIAWDDNEATYRMGVTYSW